MSLLNISIVQADLYWEDKAENMANIERAFNQIPKETMVVFLPEMFTTGFSMCPENLAEQMDGPTVAWLKELSNKHRKIICGSVIIEEGDQYYNRLLWVMPNQTLYHYDKRHLFSYAHEDEHYTPGAKRLITQVNNWKINLNVCYDLRFPVWSRQNSDPSQRYDLLAYVANWPEKRIYGWKQLLIARAIENQCYVVGCNRVGTDGNGIYHNGNSMLIDPMGAIIWESTDKESIYNISLDLQNVKKVRDRFHFLDDADSFYII